MILKRPFDIIVAGASLILLSPVLLVVAALITLHDGGPVFYRGERIGLRGRPFRIYKFRSMIAGAERTGVTSTAKGDPRVTPIGRFIRKTKIDELPQLINVLKGEMSMVGPRPEVKKFTDLYTGEEKALLTLKPGMTDYASLWNFDEAELLKDSTNPDKDYLEKIRPEKIRLQLKYLREMSLATDAKILLLTLKKILTRS
jgi:lipopolysaccharide/colanic/teichoic acid biosynthesis glycosyltransferase